MAGEMEAYADALTAFKAARAQLITYANVAAELGRALQTDPDNVAFINSAAGQNVIPGRARAIFDMINWPTSPQLMGALDKARSAYSAMITAHGQIPADRKAAVEPPPPMKPQAPGTLRF